MCNPIFLVLEGCKVEAFESSRGGVVKMHRLPGRNRQVCACLHDGHLPVKVVVADCDGEGPAGLQILPKHRMPPKSISDVRKMMVPALMCYQIPY